MLHSFGLKGALFLFVIALWRKQAGRGLIGFILTIFIHLGLG
jgi:hypothetical protein